MQKRPCRIGKGVGLLVTTQPQISPYFYFRHNLYVALKNTPCELLVFSPHGILLYCELPEKSTPTGKWRIISPPEQVVIQVLQRLFKFWISFSTNDAFQITGIGIAAFCGKIIGHLCLSEQSCALLRIVCHTVFFNNNSGVFVHKMSPSDTVSSEMNFKISSKDCLLVTIAFRSCSCCCSLRMS